MGFKYATTVEGHYTLAKGGKSWYFVPTDKKRSAAPVGPYKTSDLALEAAQHFENDYHKHKVKK